MSRIKRPLLVVVAVAIPTIVVRHSVFIVAGNSMEPALSPAAVVLALPLLPWQQPNRGEVVVVVTPKHGDLAIKRVTAIPGDCVDAFGRTSTHSAGYGEDESCIELGDGQYFVLGDNRRNSTDSRSYGPLQRQAIAARVALKIWPRLSEVPQGGSRSN